MIYNTFKKITSLKKGEVDYNCPENIQIERKIIK